MRILRFVGGVVMLALTQLMNRPLARTRLMNRPRGRRDPKRWRDGTQLFGDVRHGFKNVPFALFQQFGLHAHDTRISDRDNREASYRP